MRNFYKALIMMTIGIMTMIFSPFIIEKQIVTYFVILGFVIFLIGYISIGSFGDIIFGKEKT